MSLLSAWYVPTRRTARKGEHGRKTPSKEALDFRMLDDWIKRHKTIIQ